MSSADAGCFDINFYFDCSSFIFMLQLLQYMCCYIFQLNKFNDQSLNAIEPIRRFLRDQRQNISLSWGGWPAWAIVEMVDLKSNNYHHHHPHHRLCFPMQTTKRGNTHPFLKGNTKRIDWCWNLWKTRRNILSSVINTSIGRECLSEYHQHQSKHFLFFVN